MPLHVLNLPAAIIVLNWKHGEQNHNLSRGTSSAQADHLSEGALAEVAAEQRCLCVGTVAWERTGGKVGQGRLVILGSFGSSGPQAEPYQD